MEADVRCWNNIWCEWDVMQVKLLYEQMNLQYRSEGEYVKERDFGLVYGEQ